MLEVTALSSRQIFVLRVHLDLHPRRLAATTMEHQPDQTSWERRGLRRAYSTTTSGLGMKTPTMAFALAA
jgi:hypothetical protein